jgi:hypothetical protein
LTQSKWFKQGEQQMSNYKITAFQKWSIMVIGALSLGSSAGADGFSAEVNLPANPFTVNGAINYSYELIPNWFVGASLRANYGPFGNAAKFDSSVRLGSNYVLNLVKTPDLKADAYVGAGLNVGLTNNFSLTPEVNAGARATYSVSPMIKVYGGVDAQAALIASTISPNVCGYLGGKLEPITNLEVYAQAGLGYSSLFNYDLKLGAYYTVIPEVRLGASVGYNGDFRASVGAQFALKPGTLATPGNFLP